MAAILFDPRINLQVSKNIHEVISEEIEGLIKVCKDEYVERPQIIPKVPCTVSPEGGPIAKDVIVDRLTNQWARIYVPSCPYKLPLLFYFHGGRFCVGSAVWSYYHEFLANLTSKAGCLILSINYHLTLKNRHPAANDDGIGALMWIKQQSLNGYSEHKLWLSRCNFSSLFLAGDGVGANIAYNVATRLGSTVNPESLIKSLCLEDIILIQPFFGGET